MKCQAQGKIFVTFQRSFTAVFCLGIFIIIIINNTLIISSPLMGLFRDYIKQIQIKEQDALVKNPNQQEGGEPVGYFTRVAKDLNSGLGLPVRAGLELGGPSYYKSSALTTRASCLCILGLSHYKSCVSEVLTHLSPIIQVRDGLMS